MLRPGLSWGTPTPATPNGAAAASDRYLGDRVNAAAPAELTGMLFEAVLRNIDTAAELYANDEFSTALPHVMKAQEIITELRTTLNPEAGDIAITLESVYTWAYKNLVDAAMQHQAKFLLEARNSLAPIAEAWSTAVLGRTP